MIDISAAEKVVDLITDLATVVADVKDGGFLWKEIPEAVAILSDLAAVGSTLPQVQAEIQEALADPPTLANLLTQVIAATLKLIAATE